MDEQLKCTLDATTCEYYGDGCDYCNGMSSRDQMEVTIEQLKEEALELCSQLSKAYWRERDKYDEYRNFAGNTGYLARLDRLWIIAANRWRRRAGYV